jgi:phosphonopyruvate decarboxylase
MYAIPMLLLIGWRGRPGVKDEPQHVKMGRITVPILDVLEIPFYTLDANETSSFSKITQAISVALKEKKPVALLVPEKIFEKYDGVPETDMYSLTREIVIKEIIDNLKGTETLICTTGKTGREFYEQNMLAGQKIKKYLLSVGAMGHANHIALGIKMESGERMIVLDGDGALLMQMGSLPTIAHYATDNFIHIVINNGSHESVGGQPTEGFFADCCGIAKASGYKKTICITNDRELGEWVHDGLLSPETQFVEIRTNRKSNTNLGRPEGEPAEWKNNFMSALAKKG